MQTELKCSLATYRTIDIINTLIHNNLVNEEQPEKVVSMSDVLDRSLKQLANNVVRAPKDSEAWADFSERLGNDLKMLGECFAGDQLSAKTIHRDPTSLEGPYAMLVELTTQLERARRAINPS